MRTLVQKAKEFACQKHAHQVRKDGSTPYVKHLEGVVAILMRHGFDAPEVIAAAYLHDTVEKTDSSIGELMDMFGPDVARLVYWLTDEERGNHKMRKLMSAWRLSRAPWYVKVIKLADLIDNTRSIIEHDPAFAPTFILEKRQTMWMMADEEGERLMRLPIFREAMVNTLAARSEAQRKAG